MSGITVWKDSTGAVMPVVRVLGGEPGSGGQPTTFEILDKASGAIWGWWLTSPIQGPFVSQNQGSSPVYITSNCTGAMSVADPPINGYAFHFITAPNTYYIVPSNVTPTQGAFASSYTNSCYMMGGSAYLVPAAQLTVVTPPAAPPGTPPYHPEAL